MTIRSTDGGILDQFENHPVLNKVPLTLELTVLANSDNCQWHEDGTDFYNNINGLYMGWYAYDSIGIRTSIRFPDCTLQQGENIISAILTLTAWGTDSKAGNIDIYGNDEDNAVAPTSGADGNSKVLTTEKLSYTLPSTWVTYSTYTIDVTNIVQEIVDRAGFASGNALMLLMRWVSGVGERTHATIYTGSDPAYHPKLTINHSSD